MQHVGLDNGLHFNGAILRDDVRHWLYFEHADEDNVVPDRHLFSRIAASNGHYAVEAGCIDYGQFGGHWLAGIFNGDSWTCRGIY